MRVWCELLALCVCGVSCLRCVCCVCCSQNAAEHIRRGDADLMLAGSADAAVIPSGIGGFIACKALSKRNDDPGKASRPWDRNRDGFVMGEGGGECSWRWMCNRGGRQEVDGRD